MPNRMDDIVTKGMGAAKSVKSRPTGLVGVFQTLEQQHGEAGELLKRLEGNPDKREELWPEIRKALLSHEQGEMRVLYPELRRYPETKALADQHDREAGELEEQIDLVEATAMRLPDWEPRLEALIDLVMAHVDIEERIIFPRAQEAIGTERAREMDVAFRTMQEKLKNAD